MTVISGELIGGRYRPVELVGQGGMGRVWRARDETLHREVAIKEVHFPAGLDDAQQGVLFQRVMREARTAAALNHPGIVTVHDVADHGGTPLIVMEFLAGTSLAARIREAGPLPVPQVAQLGAAIAEALTVAHAAGVVHRDLKPDNIILAGQRVVLTDFGIASVADATMALTSTGTILGTPAYMAPEQLEGNPATPATDLWALGATLYAAVEGRPPFAAATLTALYVAILTGDPQATQHAGPLTPLLNQLLTKDPVRRATASDVAAVLETWSRRPQVELGGAGPATAAAPGSPPAPVEPPAPTAVLTQPSAGAAVTVTVPDDPATLGHHSEPEHTVLDVGADAADHESAPLTGPTRRLSRRGVLLLAGTGALAVAAVPTTLLLRDLSAPARPRGAASSPTSDPTPGTALGNHTSGARIARTIQASDQVLSLAFSPNGKSLATTGRNDKEARLWDVSTGRLASTFDTHPDTPLYTDSSVYAVAFSPDGKTLATGSDYNDTVRLWDVATARLTTTLETSYSAVTVYAMAFSPAGKTLATGGALWDVATSQLITTFTSDDVYGVAFSPDGKTLATGDSDNTARLWTSTGGSITTLTGHSATVYAVAFSPDGRTLATGSSDNTARLWEVSTGRSVATLIGHSGSVYAVAFSPDGKTLATGSVDGTVRLWHVASRRVTAVLTGSGGICSVAFSPDGKSLATGSSDNTAVLWTIP